MTKKQAVLETLSNQMVIMGPYIYIGKHEVMNCGIVYSKLQLTDDAKRNLREGDNRKGR